MASLVKTRKATFTFELLDRYEAGVALSGGEVKAIRAGKAKLDGAYVKIYDGQAVLIGASIAPYQPKNTPDSYEPDRARQLLLSKKELAKLDRQTNEANLTIVPISFYNKNGKIKLEIATARGKKKADKRQALKERAVKRDLDRTLKGE